LANCGRKATLSISCRLLADFEALGIYEGAEVIERFAETNELGGFSSAVSSMANAEDAFSLY
jgi:hypothetical protein